jgi:exopolyphosphatase/guanosine-5'-triphosphate,3'-diphosphate pyrophosphatase
MKYSCFVLVVLFNLILNPLQAEIERRAAIDVGSGGTKVLIADVDSDTKQIVNVVYENSFPVPYQSALDRSPDGTFDQATRELGLRTFKQIKEITDQHQVQRIAAVATSAFRKSNNGVEFAEQVNAETAIPLKIIPQKEEGEIAFYSAVSTGKFQEDEMLVWDIGTGSQQLTTTNEAHQLIVYMGETMGSIEFKNYIIDIVQDHDSDDIMTPNPISPTDLKVADSYARSFGRKAFPLIKDKIKNHVTVVGIGRLFFNSVRPLASEEGVITRDGLRAYISAALNKTDGDLNNPYANVDVPNCILVLAIMKALHIQEVYPLETTSTRGLLVNPSYWE